MNKKIVLILMIFCVSLRAQTAPIYVSQPSNSSASDGGSFSVNVTVNTSTTTVKRDFGFGIIVDVPTPADVTWTLSIRGRTLRPSGIATSQANNRISSSLSFGPVTAADAGSFQVVATNVFGATSSDSRILTVTPSAPNIASQPSASTINVGGSVTLSVSALGTSPITYQWKKDGVNISGANGSSYSISSAKATDSGGYSVVVTNVVGSVTSSSAKLTVNELAPAILTQPSSSTVAVGSGVSFTVSASSNLSLGYQWKKDGAFITGATSSTYTIASTKTTDAGNYTVVVTNSVGSVTSNSATLTVTAAPSIAAQPSSSSVTEGSAASFSVVATGTATLSYQWRKDGTAISGATSSTYTIASTKTTDAGSYTVVVTNSIGAVTSNSAALTILAPRLYSLAVRTALEANQILIVGFTMSGGAKNVLLRAAGPTLGAFGVPETMVDPKLDLYSGSTLITSNDNWGGSPSLAATFTSAGAFAYASATSLDAALVASINGGRTAHVYGPAAGAVLVEGYDVGSGDAQKFTSLSARNRVGTGANILIAGFSLLGEGKRNLLIRAVGPTLGVFGVPSVLSDPKLEIYQGSTKIGENDNWASTLSTTFSSVGAFGLTAGSKDAAITVALPAGGYTVQVSGADGGVGEALVEIYELP
jgi:hypothetical protein